MLKLGAPTPQLIHGACNVRPRLVEPFLSRTFGVDEVDPALGFDFREWVGFAFRPGCFSFPAKSIDCRTPVQGEWVMLEVRSGVQSLVHFVSLAARAGCPFAGAGLGREGRFRRGNKVVKTSSGPIA